MKNNISKHIFRAYDIRGIYQDDISPELFYKIGQAAGTYVIRILKGKNLTVGNDIRQSSSALVYSFISGLSSTGVDVQVTGTSTFGQTLFAGWQSNQSLIAFVTALRMLSPGATQSSSRKTPIFRSRRILTISRATFRSA